MPKISQLFSKEVKSVGLFGLGRSNLALLNLLPEKTPVTLRSDGKIERGTIPSSLKIKAIYEGAAALENIDEDMLILSPSVRRERPEIALALASGKTVTSDAELFFEGVTSPVYAVSGSDGKSTVATLTSLLLGEGTALCGNIGVPMLRALSGGYSRYVTELSSFMLRYLNPTCERAVLTNVTKNHLDWHADFEEYTAAKLGIYKNAREPVLNFDDALVRENMTSKTFAAVSDEVDFSTLKRAVRAEVYYTVEGGYIKRCGEPYIEVAAVKRRERHNLKNLMLALAMTDDRHIDARRVATEFGGLPHRCEVVTTHRGITYINSSVDTSPARCGATLSAQGAPTVVILGGRGKGVPFDEIREPLMRVGRGAVLYGECRDEIERALPEGLPTRRADTMDEAVRLATALARQGDTVLLSPAATSYDRYKSFEERGEDFKKSVKEYCEKHS